MTKNFEGKGFSLRLEDDYVVLELNAGQDELNREMLAEGIAYLQKEYDGPFGCIFCRPAPISIDLVSARRLLAENLPRLVAAANVSNDRTTRRNVDYEKTVIDLFPIETFGRIEEAKDWVSAVVRKSRSHS
ncbi:MAG: hypothetical protein KDM91_22730 [Verrucomicrobiae bacterium]|nr:hypothetical protein [Verrucomicrobiae bacterium]MCP5539003.1 hypothetical protein [Akkermansiaceae bacterium]MCP5550610.1 hypothetical protein [Akkermansiaceae bacterium]